MPRGCAQRPPPSRQFYVLIAFLEIANKQVRAQQLEKRLGPTLPNRILATAADEPACGSDGAKQGFQAAWRAQQPSSGVNNPE